MTDFKGKSDVRLLNAFGGNLRSYSVQAISEYVDKANDPSLQLHIARSDRATEIPKFKILIGLLDDIVDLCLLFREFWVEISKIADNRFHEGCNEARLAVEDVLAIAHSPPQYPPQDIFPALVPWPCAISNSKRERADVVSNHSVGHILVAFIFLTDLGTSLISSLDTLPCLLSFCFYNACLNLCQSVSS